MTMREPPTGNVAPNTSGQPVSPSPTSSNPGGAGTGYPGTPSSAQQQSQGGVGAVKDQIGEQVGPAVDQVQEKAGQAFGQVRQQVTTQLDSQKDKAAEGLTQAADAVRKTGEHLRKQEQMGVVANYADDAAETIERLAGFLQERDIGQILGETERFARQRPTMFLASAFTLGLMAARFFKSSSPNSGMGSGYGQAPQRLANPSYTPTPMRSQQPSPSVHTSTPTASSTAGTTGVGTVGTPTPQPPSTQSAPNMGSSSPPNRGS